MRARLAAASAVARTPRTSWAEPRIWISPACDIAALRAGGDIGQRPRIGRMTAVVERIGRDRQIAQLDIPARAPASMARSAVALICRLPLAACCTPEAARWMRARDRHIAAAVPPPSLEKRIGIGPAAAIAGDGIGQQVHRAGDNECRARLKREIGATDGGMTRAEPTRMMSSIRSSRPALMLRMAWPEGTPAPVPCGLHVDQASGVDSAAGLGREQGMHPIAGRFDGDVVKIDVARRGLEHDVPRLGDAGAADDVEAMIGVADASPAVRCRLALWRLDLIGRGGEDDVAAGAEGEDCRCRHAAHGCCRGH